MILLGRHARLTDHLRRVKSPYNYARSRVEYHTTRKYGQSSNTTLAVLEKRPKHVVLPRRPGPLPNRQYSDIPTLDDIPYIETESGSYPVVPGRGKPREYLISPHQRTGNPKIDLMLSEPLPPGARRVLYVYPPAREPMTGLAGRLSSWFSGNSASDEDDPDTKPLVLVRDEDARKHAHRSSLDVLSDEAKAELKREQDRRQQEAKAAYYKRQQEIKEKKAKRKPAPAVATRTAAVQGTLPVAQGARENVVGMDVPSVGEPVPKPSPAPEKMGKGRTLRKFNPKPLPTTGTATASVYSPSTYTALRGTFDRARADRPTPTIPPRPLALNELPKPKYTPPTDVAAEAEAGYDDLYDASEAKAADAKRESGEFDALYRRPNYPWLKKPRPPSDFLEDPLSKSERHAAKKIRKEARRAKGDASAELRLAELAAAASSDRPRGFLEGIGASTEELGQAEGAGADLISAEAAEKEEVDAIEAWLEAMDRAESTASSYAPPPVRPVPSTIATRPSTQAPPPPSSPAPPLNQQTLASSKHINEVRAYMDAAELPGNFPRSLPPVGEFPAWDEMYTSGWPFLLIADALPFMPPGHIFQPPKILFDHTKLPPLIPIMDPELRREATESYEADARVKWEFSAWLGDSKIDEAFTRMIENDAGRAWVGQYLRGLLVANTTLSWLAIHYGLMNQLPRVYLSTARGGQKALGTAFEAWIGAAERDYRRRGEKDVFDAWLDAVFHVDVWPEALRIVYNQREMEPPGESFPGSCLDAAPTTGQPAFRAPWDTSVDPLPEGMASGQGVSDDRDAMIRALQDQVTVLQDKLSSVRSAHWFPVTPRIPPARRAAGITPRKHLRATKPKPKLTAKVKPSRAAYGLSKR